jgi:O-antigen/teichoic acid export membrane protein
VSSPTGLQDTVDVLGTSAAGPAAVRGGTIRIGAYFVGALASAGSAALLFRHLGVVDTGRYVTILSLVAIVAGISDLGLGAVGVRESSVRPAAERPQLLGDLLGLRLTMTGLGLLVMLMVAAFGYSGTMVLGVLLAGIGLLLQTAQDNLVVPLVTGLQLGRVAAVDLTRALLTVLVITGLVLAGAGLVPFTAVSIPVGACALAIAALLVRGQRSLRPSFNWSRWRPLVMSVLPYSAAVAAATIYFRVAIIIVSQLASAHELGLFSASFRILEVLTVVPGLLAGAALPIFARAASDDHERLGYALGRVFEVALIAGAGVAVMIAVGAGLAIDIIGGARFAAASDVLAIQGVALAAVFVGTVWGNGLLSLGMYRQILVLNLTALLGTAALLCVLVPLDGARGAAIGTATGEVAATLATVVILVARHPRLRPPLRVVPRVGLAAAAGLAPLAIDGAPVVARLAISIALFSAVLLVTRALPAELRALLPGARARSADP